MADFAREVAEGYLLREKGLEKTSQRNKLKREWTTKPGLEPHKKGKKGRLGVWGKKRTKGREERRIRIEWRVGKKTSVAVKKKAKHVRS